MVATSQPISRPPVGDVSPPANRDFAHEIQWCPPGSHCVRPGNYQVTKVLVFQGNEKFATTANEQLQKWRRAAKCEADFPTGTFGHNGGKAAFFAKRFFWAGNHPLLGGIRLEVDWTLDGRRGVCLGEFRKFSARFLTGQGDEFVGLDPRDVGGLVHESACKKIAPLPMHELRAATLRDTQKFLQLIKEREQGVWTLSRKAIDDLKARNPRLGNAYDFAMAGGIRW